MGFLHNKQKASLPAVASLLALQLLSCSVSQLSFAESSRIDTSENATPPESIFTQNANALLIFELSGVQSHLLTVPETIVEEAEFERSRCTGSDATTISSESIVAAFNTRQMAGRFTNQLNEKLGQHKLKAIAEWYDSDLGKRIVKAEKSAVEIESAQFDILLQAYLKTTRWNQTRANAVSNMLNATGAVDFISAVHTEITAAVAVASVCDVNQIAKVDVEKNIKKIRADESFYLAFLRGELVAPSAFVYQSVSTSDLEEFTQFAQSELGAEYFNTLVQISRSVVAHGVEELAELSESN